MKSLGLAITDSMSSSARCNFSKSFVLGSTSGLNCVNSTQHGNKPKDVMFGGGENLPVSPNNGDAARIGPFTKDDGFKAFTVAFV